MKRVSTRIIAILSAFVLLASAFPTAIFAVEEGIELIGDVQGNIPDMKITIDAGYSLDTIHNSKEEKIRAHVSVSNSWDSSFDMRSTGIEMKTRGNSTFGYMKKPYQIKFDSKTDMFGMGEAKKWILLANYVDGSFIRNKIVFDLADGIGMEYVCKSVFVNLYINGDYKGVYQFCEKVEIGDNRIPLEHDLAVLAEMESEKRVYEEEFFFHTSVTRKPFVYKEYNTDFEDSSLSADIAATKEYFEGRINAVEAELFNNGKDWEKLSSLIDVDSFIQFYFINEFCMNVDATLASTFFYMDGPDDVLHMGPIWDYDRCFGTYNDGSYEQSTDADFLKNITDCSDEYRVEWFKMLFRYPEFAERVNELYDTVVKDVFDAERVNATIDAYQAVLWDSLMRNYVDEGWAIFHSISDAEFFSNRTAAGAYLNFTTDAIKDNIRNREYYLDRAYGEYNPLLFYKAGNGRTYSGGSMTDSATISSLTLSLDSKIDGGITYQANTSSGAVISAVKDGETLAGGSFAGFKATLFGNLSNYFSIQYRVFRNGNWSSWASDGAVAGARSGGAMSRIQIRLVRKADIALGTLAFDCREAQTIAPVSAVAGNVVALPETNVADYVFHGWYTDSEYTTPYTEESFVMQAGTTTLYAKYTSIYLGDISFDGVVDAKDLNLLLKLVAGSVAPSEKQIEAADMNGDGQLSAIDVNILSKTLAGAN